MNLWVLCLSVLELKMDSLPSKWEHINFTNKCFDPSIKFFTSMMLKRKDVQINFVWGFDLNQL